MPPKPPLRVPRAPPKARPPATTSRPPNSRPTFAQPATRSPARPPPSSKPTAYSASAPPPPPPPSARWLTARQWGKSASFGILFFCGALFIRDNFICKDTVNGSSMAPTLSPYAHETGAKDSIIIRRDIRRDRRGIRRGDVVTFWKPHKPEEISVKRVVAVAGDIVYPWRGYAVDPDVVLGDRVGGGWDGLGERDRDAVGGGVQVGRVVVPEGHVWVEGDNWRASYDSLDFGPVSLGLVDGRAVGVWREWWRVRGVGDGRDGGRRERSRVVEAVRPPPVL